MLRIYKLFLKIVEWMKMDSFDKNGHKWTGLDMNGHKWTQMDTK